MKGVLVLLLVVLALAHMGEGLSCPAPCNRDDCPPVSCGDRGVGTDICGCCPACLKGIGEECGGIWNHGGNCDVGLTCSNPFDSSFSYDNQGPGECHRHF